MALEQGNYKGFDITHMNQLTLVMLHLFQET